MRGLCAVFLVFVVSIASCAEHNSISEVDAFLSGVEKQIPRIQLKNAETLFTDLRKAVALPEFPFRQFGTALSRYAKDTEQAVSKASRRSSQFDSLWRAVRRAGTIEDAFQAKRIMYAFVAIDELHTDSKELVEAASGAKALAEGLLQITTEGYIPDNPLERTLDSWGLHVELIAVLLILLAPVFAVTKTWRMRGMILAGAVLVATAASFSGHMVVRNAWRGIVGPPEVVTRVRSLSQSGLEALKDFESGTKEVSATLGQLLDYCNDANELNASLTETIASMTKHLAEIRSENSQQLTKAEVAHSLVNSTRNVLKEHRRALMRSSKHEGTLASLVGMVDNFDLMLVQTSLSIYVNLRTGGDLNRQLAIYLGRLLDYIDSGNLRECLIVLEKVKNEQRAHLEALRIANAFLRSTNDAVDKIRRESSRLQPEFATLEFDAWLKKTAATVVATGSALGAPATALLASTAGVAVLPAATLGIAVAAVGYHWKNSYAAAEKDAKALVLTLSDMDKILHRTEEALSENEKLLVLLMEDIGGVLKAVNRSEKRFELVKSGRIFTSQEVDLLKGGINMVISAVDELADSYCRSAAQMEKEAGINPLAATRTSLPALEAAVPTNGAANDGGHEGGDGKDRN